MAFKTIDALPAKGQRLLLRADLNVSLHFGYSFHEFLGN
jgi:hypothetical protein